MARTHVSVPHLLKTVLLEERAQAKMSGVQRFPCCSQSPILGTPLVLCDCKPQKHNCYCTKCGAYAETKVETKGKVRLTKQCIPPTKSSERSLARIRARKHAASDISHSRSYGLCWMSAGGSGQAACPLPPIASWRILEEPPATSIGNPDIDSD